MPLDVELSVLTAGGLLEPRADWTESAEKYMSIALQRYQDTRGAQLVKYHQPEGEDLFEQKLIEIERLHSVVGQAILTHEYNNQLKLPSKGEAFDWTLGADVSALKDKYKADYALFLFVRDSYSSAGRIFMQLFAAALGVGIAGGQQLGFASLVDLNTGKISWFNRLFSGVGDIRTQESAEQTVALLLEGLPE